MPFILILLKIGILASYGSILKMILDFQKKDSSVKVSLDLLSKIEISAVAGINLIGFVSVIDEKKYAFTCGLCCIGIVLALFQKYRLILAGQKMVMIKGKTYSFKELKKLGTGMFTLHVYKKANPKPMKIYVPLTSNEVLKNRVESRIHQA